MNLKKYLRNEIKSRRQLLFDNAVKGHDHFSPLFDMPIVDEVSNLLALNDRLNKTRAMEGLVK